LNSAANRFYGCELHGEIRISTFVASMFPAGLGQKKEGAASSAFQMSERVYLKTVKRLGLK
jgi:hypothetical protein